MADQNYKSDHTVAIGVIIIVGLLIAVPLVVVLATKPTL